MNKLKLFFNEIFALLEGDIDKHESAISPSISESARVDAFNRSRIKRCLELDAELRFLNAKYPEKDFFRKGALIKERNGDVVPSTKGFDRNDGDNYLRKNEVPDLIKGLLSDSQRNEVFWDREQKGIIVKFDEVGRGDKDYVEWTKMIIPKHGSGYAADSCSIYSIWAKELFITQLPVDQATMRPQVLIEPSVSLLLDEDYLAFEVAHQGRLYIRNNVGNSSRYLLNSVGSTPNTVEVQGDLLSVQLNRRYHSPNYWGLFDKYTTKIMEKKNLIEGLERRLWFRYKVCGYRENEDFAFLQLKKSF
jgi:hypothetical protein